MSYIFIGSLLMQQVLGYSPTRTGVSWLATTVTVVVVAMTVVMAVAIASRRAGRFAAVGASATTT